MHGNAGLPFGEEEAHQILQAGWRQGRVFRPPLGYPLPVPFDYENEWLVVCTQSCTVVSADLDRDPHIEFLVAKPAAHYKANSPEATGKNQRRFHLPVSGLPGVTSLECDINRRFFEPRALCLSNPPDVNIVVSEDAVRNLAGWISRYYTRVALPNELVRRAKGLFGIIKEALRDNTRNGEMLSNSIDKILVRWSPDTELPNGLYKIDILFLCADGASDLRLNSLLEVRLQQFTEKDGHDGIKLTYENTVRSQTFLSQLDGYKRLSEWDYLSNLGSVAESEQ